MAITAAVVRSTPYSVAFLCTQDGAAGTTLTITNAVLVAALAAHNSAFRDMIDSDIAGATQALLRRTYLGDSVAAPDLTDVPHSRARIVARDVIGGWAVDVDVDAVNALRGELNVVGPAGASNAVISLEFAHTYDR